jgi:tetratricopeptide (TPR) repeat protein
VGAVAAVLLTAGVLGGGGGLWWTQKRSGAESEARVAMREAIGLLEEERWPEAISAARRAEGVLAGVGADPGLRWQARELIKELEIARKLEEAGLQATAAGKDQHFDDEPADAAYAAAFGECGLDVDGPDPQSVAERIRARPIHRQLVAALDDWARVRKSLGREGWKHRLAVARAADPDAWRSRLRDALEREEPKAIEEVAGYDQADEWPVPTLHLLSALASEIGSGEQVAAILERAQRRHPDDFWINHMLGQLFRESRPRRLEEVIRFWSVAVAIRPQSPAAHVNLGSALQDKGRLDEAIAEYREALHLKDDCIEARNNLGNALADKGHVDEAIAEYRKALHLKEDSPQVHSNLGNALANKGQPDEAIAEYREAIRLKKDYALAHANLGSILRTKGRLDEAIAECREAVRLEKDFAAAHCNLGVVLLERGQFREALVELRRGHELGSLTPGWSHPSAQLLKSAERLSELDARLPALLMGQEQPKNAGERLALAQLCQLYKKHFAAAARRYGEAFAEQPALADDLSTGNRYNAACAAALAGCGQGQDANRLSDKGRAGLRKQALDWLSADLRAWRNLLEKGPAQNRPAIAQQLAHWLEDTDLSGVRGPDTLAKLPEAERQPWRSLWADVAATLARAQGKTAPEQRPGAK